MINKRHTNHCTSNLVYLFAGLLLAGFAGCSDTDGLSGPVDSDGDGLIGAEDCDDTNSDVGAGNMFYADVDGDGLGDPRITVRACEPAEGFVANADDTEPECATNNTDLCGVCAGSGGQTLYADADGDGLGDPAIAIDACTTIEGFVDNADDMFPTCATDVVDVCGVCSGPGETTFYADVDGDGMGDPDTSITLCEAPIGYVTNADDLDPTCETNDTDECGVCAGENGDMDCNKDCFGDALLDQCNRCVGGNTGRTEATMDSDEDGIPDRCDSDCMGQERFIVQWTNVRAYEGDAGPYTFQAVLFDNGNILFQYAGVGEPFEATATVGIQDDNGEEAIEFGHNSNFAAETPTVLITWDAENNRYVADYNTDFYWYGVQTLGEAVELDDDEEIVRSLDFPFPFYGKDYTDIAISSNGFLALTEPYGEYDNTSFPNNELGALIAPFWEDLNPGRGNGAMYIYKAPVTCESDCNDVVGGFSVLEPACDVCLTGLEEGPSVDCNGVCGGTATIDGCGVCAGGDTGIEVQELDCNGVCGGTAYNDTCRVCVGGDTGLEPTTPECAPGVDLTVDQQYLADTLYIDEIQVDEDDCLIMERCVRGPGARKVIRFGTRIANKGTVDLQLGNPEDEDNPNREFWHFDECHSHFHYEAYAAYQIFDVAADELLDIGSKNGFCVLDTAVDDPAYADSCLGYNCGNQGITAGCQDTYPASLECQWIDVTGLPDGEYDVIVTTNPNQEIPEWYYDNNTARVRVLMEGDAVTVIEETDEGE